MDNGSTCTHHMYFIIIRRTLAFFCLEHLSLEQLSLSPPTPIPRSTLRMHQCTICAMVADQFALFVPAVTSTDLPPPPHPPSPFTNPTCRRRPFRSLLFGLWPLQTGIDSLWLPTHSNLFFFASFTNGTSSSPSRAGYFHTPLLYHFCFFFYEVNLFSVYGKMSLLSISLFYSLWHSFPFVVM